MKITKDTKVSVDVRKCSTKEKRLVINHFRSLTGEGMASVAAAAASALFINLNYSFHIGEWSYSSSGASFHPTIISFKKFLKSANPYKGDKYDISFDSEKQKRKIVKRLEKMGYTHVLTPIGNSVVYINGDPKYGFGIASSFYTPITYKQFMNFEVPGEKPLKFKEWDVTDNGKTISVGCRTFHKKTALRLLERLEDVSQYATPDEVYEFLRDNKDALT